MSEKNYSVVVRLKEKGDFDTLYCEEVKKVKDFLVCTIRRKDGTVITREQSLDSIEAIEYINGEKPVQTDQPWEEEDTDE